MPSPLRSLLIVAGLSSVLLPLQAQIITPTLTSGASAVNPLARTLVSAENSTSLTSMRAVTGHAAVQSFVGFTGSINSGDARGFDFANTALPDVQFIFGGSPSSGVSTIGSADYTSSAGNSLRLETAAGQSMTLRMNFGSYSGTTFTSSPSGQGVASAGFTLNGRLGTASSVSITYLDSFGGTLSSQYLDMSKITPSTSTIDYAYSGFAITEGQLPISSVLISITAKAGTYGTFTAGLDDLVITPLTSIPEPSSFGVLMGGAAITVCLLSPRRQRSDKL